MLVNAFISFARHFACIAREYSDVVTAVQQSLDACPTPQHMTQLAFRILPSLKECKGNLG